jgi:hypothetical protein
LKQAVPVRVLNGGKTGEHLFYGHSQRGSLQSRLAFVRDVINRLSMPERFLEETRLAAPTSPVQTAKSTLARGERPLQAGFLIFSIQEW